MGRMNKKEGKERKGKGIVSEFYRDNCLAISKLHCWGSSRLAGFSYTGDSPDVQAFKYMLAVFRSAWVRPTWGAEP
jgi:hypothetical protein